MQSEAREGEEVPDTGTIDLAEMSCRSPAPLQGSLAGTESSRQYASIGPDGASEPRPFTLGPRTGRIPTLPGLVGHR
jgi:hypothetical protein